MQLSGKSVLVTGAGSGIGAEIARAFAQAGAKVCVADIDLQSATEVVEELGVEPGSAMAVRMDVTSEDEVERGVNEVARAFGGVDVLVSNAGLHHLSELADVSFQDWKRILAVHLDGGFLTTRASLRHMRAQQHGGTILLMGSVHSKEASAQKGPYVAAKHGLFRLCRTIAKEGRRIWGAVQSDLPWIRSYASRRAANSSACSGAGHHRGRRDTRRNARHHRRRRVHCTGRYRQGRGISRGISD